MDRQLVAPLRLQSISGPNILSTTDAHKALGIYLSTLPASSSSRSQLERLTDSLGVDLGLIRPDESHRREEERRAARAEKRKTRREERERIEMEGIEREVEGLNGDAKEEVDLDILKEGLGRQNVEGPDEVEEEGAAEFEDEGDMGDRGDVEYGDEELEDDDDDEPDKGDEGQQKMDVDME